MSAGAFSETDLATPLYEYLAGLGYTVRSEVKDCDIAAVKGEDLLVIELKKSLSLSLIVQATQRQRLTDLVYVAVPRPANKWTWWKESRGVRHLLRRLEIGLILISLDPDRPAVEVVSQPLPLQRRRRPQSRRAVLAEISGRTADFNRAGSSRRKLVTAYRESAIRIACCLAAKGSLTPAELRRMGTGEKTLSILRFNAYGWFQRVQRGVYALTTLGQTELDDYPALRRRYTPRRRRSAS